MTHPKHNLTPIPELAEQLLFVLTGLPTETIPLRDEMGKRLGVGHEKLSAAYQHLIAAGKITKIGRGSSFRLTITDSGRVLVSGRHQECIRNDPHPIPLEPLGVSLAERQAERAKVAQTVKWLARCDNLGLTYEDSAAASRPERRFTGLPPATRTLGGMIQYGA